MGEFAYAALSLELPLGMGMIVFAIIMSLPIRWLSKRQKPSSCQRDFIFDVYVMLTATGLTGSILVLHYIFLTMLKG